MNNIKATNNGKASISALKKSVLCLLFALFALFSAVFTPSADVYAAEEGAEKTVKMTLATSDVLTDLIGTTIEGKEFNLKDYPYAKDKETRVIALIEGCYTYHKEDMSRYGLYVYVYNPQGKAFDEGSERNKIQMRFSKAGGYSKYPLTFVNRSTQKGTEGLFYKFKVTMPNREVYDVHDMFGADERIYSVSEIELSCGGTVSNYPSGVTYRYRGFAEGCGAFEGSPSSLTCRTDGLELMLSLDVHSTYYRPEGTNGKNEFTQDNLHSVYFAVPNKTIREYGEMTAVHATWLNAVLAPALVTGNQDAYNAIYPYLGVNTGDGLESIGYLYYGDEEYVQSVGTMLCGYSYNEFSDYKVSHNEKVGNWVNPLYFLFNSGIGDNSADKYVVSSEAIEKELNESAVKYGGSLVNEKYSRYMFASVDNEFTNINIQRDETYELTSQVIEQTWWEKLWGNNHVQSSVTFNGIKAIYAIDKTKDLSGTVSDISKRLYVAESDCNALKNYCNKSENADSTVYLFRYRVTDYTAQEAALYKKRSLSIKRVDTNAYFFQQSVDLDFDIIDLTFTKDNVETVIPVAMKPLEIIVTDATPPVDTTPDPKPAPDEGGFWNWLKDYFVRIFRGELKWYEYFYLIPMLFVAGIAVALLFPLYYVLKFIFKMLWKLFSTPFKAIARSMKNRKRTPKRSREERDKPADSW